MAGRFLAEASGDAPLPGRAARAPDIFLAVDTISSGMGRMFSAYIACAVALVAAFAVPLAQAMTADDLLEPEEAFRFAVRSTQSSGVEIEYTIADGYYLYRDKFKFAVRTAGVTLASAQFPAGEIREDKFFGRSETYRRQLRIALPVRSAASEFTLTVTSQGCADAGVCYPPQDHEAVIRLAAVTAPSTPAQGAAAPAPSASDDDYFRGLIRSGGVWATILAFFGAGLLLAFTPCVLPMVPILSSIIVGEGRITRLRAFVLSLAYVLGMAVTYTAIGIAAALSGTLFSNSLQNAWVLGGFAILLAAVSLSMFGLYELRLPGFMLSPLNSAQSGLRGGKVASVALMGMLSAAIVSPCVAAPLAGALLYIGQTGDTLLGGAALFSMAAGMGVPLLLIGISGAAFLPKTGPWMNAVKYFFGVLLLALAIWMVAPVLPSAAHLALWAALLIGVAVFLGALDSLPPDAPAVARLAKTLGILALIAGAAQGYGALSGATDPLQPIAAVKANRDAAGQAVRFEGLRTLAELDSRVGSGRTPVMLDFSAAWCVACKEMDRFTFSDPRVQARLAGIRLLRADVTHNTAEDKAMLKRFRLFGPPGIIFFDGEGRELTDARVIGYQPPDKFLTTLDRVAQPRS